MASPGGSAPSGGYTANASSSTQAEGLRSMLFQALEEWNQGETARS